MKYCQYLILGLIGLTLMLAGPISLGLAYMNHTPQIVRVATAPAPMASGYMTVQAQAAEVTEAVPPTQGQEVTIEWGNWVKVLVTPLQALATTIAALIVPWLLTMIPGWVKLVFPVSRFNDLVENAVISAIASVSKAADGKKLTVTVTNDVVRQAIIYMLANAPGMIEHIGTSLPTLIQKVLARLPKYANVPDAYSIEEATKNVTPKSIAAAAKAQNIDEDAIKKHLGG